MIDANSSNFNSNSSNIDVASKKVKHAYFFNSVSTSKLRKHLIALDHYAVLFVVIIVAGYPRLGVLERTRNVSHSHRSGRLGDVQLR